VNEENKNISDNMKGKMIQNIDGLSKHYRINGLKEPSHCLYKSFFDSYNKFVLTFLHQKGRGNPRDDNRGN
jgi:hypothetical protein